MGGMCSCDSLAVQSLLILLLFPLPTSSLTSLHLLYTPWAFTRSAVISASCSLFLSLPQCCIISGELAETAVQQFLNQVYFSLQVLSLFFSTNWGQLAKYYHFLVREIFPLFYFKLLLLLFRPLFSIKNNIYYLNYLLKLRFSYLFIFK